MSTEGKLHFTLHQPPERNVPHLKCKLSQTLIMKLKKKTHKNHLGESVEEPYFCPHSNRLLGWRRPAEEAGGPRTMPSRPIFSFCSKTWQGSWFQAALIRNQMLSLGLSLPRKDVSSSASAFQQHCAAPVPCRLLRQACPCQEAHARRARA